MRNRETRPADAAGPVHFRPPQSLGVEFQSGLLSTIRNLNSVVEPDVPREDSIFRIDHFLGKEGS